MGDLFDISRKVPEQVEKSVKSMKHRGPLSSGEVHASSMCASVLFEGNVAFS